MDDLISRQAAIDAICKACSIDDDYVKCAERRPESTFCDEIVALRKVPSTQTIDPVKHGHWIFSPDHREGICSRCNSKIYGRPYQNTYVIVPYKYCPNCGALMDEVSE